MNKYRQQSQASQARRLRWRGCERKRGYASAEEARQPGNDIYQCKWCGQWHRTGAAAHLRRELEMRNVKLGMKKCPAVPG